MSTPIKSPTPPGPKGLTLLSGIGIFSNQRIPDSSKTNSKLFDVWLYLPGFGKKQQVLAALHWWDNGSIDWNEYLPNGAFFINAHVAKYSHNIHGYPIASADYSEDPKQIQLHNKSPTHHTDEYHLVGDIISMAGILDWSEVIIPNIPQFVTISGAVNSAIENQEASTIECTLNVPQYLLALGGNGEFSVIAKIDMNSNRWKPCPPKYARRAPYLKAGHYATVSGSLSGVVCKEGKVIMFRIDATDAVLLGKAPNHLPLFESERDSEAADSPLKNRGKGRRKQGPIEFDGFSNLSGPTTRKRAKLAEDNETAIQQLDESAEAQS